MNAVLIRLRWMLMVGQFRRWWKFTKTLKGAVCAILVLFWLASIILPNLLLAKHKTEPNPDYIRVYSPMLLFVLCLPIFFQSKSKLGILFKPAEIDFLFPAPIPRRQLILHKITGLLATNLYAASFLVVVSARQFPSLLAGWLGVYLGMTFVAIFSFTVTLLMMTISERAHSLGRRILLGGIIAIVLAGLVQTLSSTIDPTIFASAEAFQKSVFGRILLTPFEPFGRVMAGDFSDPKTYGWSAVGVGLIVFLVWCIIKLDANFLEASANNSQALFDKLQRIRKGGATAGAEIKGERTWTLPRLPHLRGSGPIFWQQLSSAIRQRSGLPLLLIIIGVSVGVSFFVRHQDKDPSTFVKAMTFPAIAIFVFTVPALLTFDFRAHIDRLDWLKTLPVSPLMMFAGQIATPVLIATLLQATFLFCAVLIFGVEMQTGGIVLAFLPVANTIMIGLENIFFLLFPVRVLAGGADFQSGGRNMVVMLIKLCLMVLVAGIIGGIGGLCWLVFGGSIPALIAGCWTGALIASFCIFPIGAWAWLKLDPAADLPA